MYKMKLIKKNNYTSIKILLLVLIIFFNITSVFATDLNFKNETENNADEYFDYDLGYDTNQNIQVWDPLEKINRKIYTFNEFLLKDIAKPLYYNVYIKITTTGIRRSIGNIVNNFRMPINFANYILQLDFRNAAASLYSFAVNTIYGIGGIFDVASYQKVFVSNTNLGITLAKYGVPAGPYLMLPFLGPNDLRGTLSWGTELSVGPFSFNLLKIGGSNRIFEDWVLYTRTVFNVVDKASYAVVNLYDLMQASFDPYTMTRDAYGQSQYYKINNN